MTDEADGGSRRFSVFLREILTGPAGFFGLIFLGLIVFNLSHLFDPPYWDAITGVFSQGIWLHQNHFDFAKLIGEPDYVLGGPNINVFLLYAPLFGFLIHYLPPHKAFFVLHILNILFATLTITVFFVILRDRMPVRLALLWIGAGIFNPIWSGQTAAIYLEVPVAAFVSLSLFSFWRNNYAAAGVFCLAGYFLKDTIILLALAYATFVVLFLIWKHLFRKGAPEIPGKGLAWLGLPVLVMVLLNQFIPSYTKINWDIPKQLKNLLAIGPSLCPDLLAVTAFLLLVLVHRLLGGKGNGQASKASHDACFILLLGILIAGFWAAIVLYHNPLVRYTTLILFPTLCLLSLLLARHRRVSMACASLIALFGIVNQNGYLLRPLPLYASRSGEALERSREYLTDLKANIAMCRYLEENHREAAIVTKYPFTQMLTLRELGYVRAPLDKVLVAGRVPTITGAMPYVPGKGSAEGALYLFSPNIFERTWRPTLYPPLSKTVVVEDSSLRDSAETDFHGTNLVYQR